MGKISKEMSKRGELDQCMRSKGLECPPQSIFLQQYENWKEEGFVSGEEVTWCQDRINPYDVEYIRHDRFRCIEELEAENKTLRTAFKANEEDNAEYLEMIDHKDAVIENLQAQRRVANDTIEGLHMAFHRAIMKLKGVVPQQYEHYYSQLICQSLKEVADES